MKAAILYKANTPLEVVDVEQQGPQAGEARVRVMATGVCHSDWHIINGDWTLPLPMVLERTLDPLRWVRLCALRHARRDAPPAPQRAGHQPDGAPRDLRRVRRVPRRDAGPDRQGHALAAGGADRLRGAHGRGRRDPLR